MSYVNSSRKTFLAGEDLEPYRLATLVSGKVSHCDEGFLPVGCTETYAEDGGPVSVRLMNTEGTMEIEATGAVAMGNEVALDADGKIKADPGSGARTVVGRALSAVAAGGVIEIMPYPASLVYSA